MTRWPPMSAAASCSSLISLASSFTDPNASVCLFAETYTYQWSITAAPVGSAIGINDPSIVQIGQNQTNAADDGKHNHKATRQDGRKRPKVRQPFPTGG